MRLSSTTRAAHPAPPAYAGGSALPERARDGCTRGGSPGIFGKFGGYGASPTPAASSRSTHSSSTRRSQTVSSIAACTSPSEANRARHRDEREVLGLDVGQLVPGDGRRDRRVGPRPHRVRRGDRAVAGVLVVVDEHLLAPLLLPPRGRDELGRAPLDLARERERAAAHDRELPLRLDPAGDVDAAVARRLRPAGVADLGERLAHDRGDRLRVGEVGPGLRVDVDAQLVGMLGVGAPRGPGVEVDHGEVRGPRDLRQLGHAELVGVTPRGERDARRLDPLRALLGHALLVDLLALDPVGEAAQLRRSLAQRAHDPLADREVVADEVALRVPRRREQHLVGVRDLDDTLPDLDLDERRGHALTVSGPAIVSYYRK